MNFEYFYKWVQKHLQLDLYSYKEKQLQRRILSIMTNTGASSLEEYAELINSEPEIKQQFLDYITINVTEFYRNRELFTEFSRVVSEEILSQYKQLKIWSAACSVGAEPYTVAMIADQNEWPLGDKILATDIDKPVLIKAKKGCYKDNELKNLSINERQKYFSTTTEGQQICRKLSNMIRFKQHDLLQSPYDKGFHIIICRNVTIYFKNEARDEIYRKFHKALVPGGIFFTGATETINNPESIGFKKISTFIYQKI